MRRLLQRGSGFLLDSFSRFSRSLVSKPRSAWRAASVGTAVSVLCLGVGFQQGRGEDASGLLRRTNRKQQDGLIMLRAMMGDKYSDDQADCEAHGKVCCFFPPLLLARIGWLGGEVVYHVGWLAGWLFVL